MAAYFNCDNIKSTLFSEQWEQVTTQIRNKIVIDISVGILSQGKWFFARRPLASWSTLHHCVGMPRNNMDRSLHSSCLISPMRLSLDHYREVPPWVVAQEDVGKFRNIQKYLQFIEILSLVRYKVLKLHLVKDALDLNVSPGGVCCSSQNEDIFIIAIAIWGRRTYILYTTMQSFSHGTFETKAFTDLVVLVISVVPWWLLMHMKRKSRKFSAYFLYI